MFVCTSTSISGLHEDCWLVLGINGIPEEETQCGKSESMVLPRVGSQGGDDTGEKSGKCSHPLDFALGVEDSNAGIESRDSSKGVEVVVLGVVDGVP